MSRSSDDSTPAPTAQCPDGAAPTRTVGTARNAGTARNVGTAREPVGAALVPPDCPATDVLRHGLFIEHDIKVSTYDIDFVGHVSNISYFRWLEDMRSMLFDKYFPLQNFVADEKTPVLASTSIQYKRPIRLFDRPHGLMWMADMGLATLTIQAELTVDGVVTTTAEHVGVFIDMNTHKPIRVPTLLIEQFKNVRGGACTGSL